MPGRFASQLGSRGGFTHNFCVNTKRTGVNSGSATTIGSREQIYQPPDRPGLRLSAAVLLAELADSAAFIAPFSTRLKTAAGQRHTLCLQTLLRTMYR